MKSSRMHSGPPSILWVPFPQEHNTSAARQAPNVHIRVIFLRIDPPLWYLVRSIINPIAHTTQESSL